MSNLKIACLFAVVLCQLVLTEYCAAQSPGTWGYYRRHFISEDGRVIDFFQNKTSHSEGQGYGMLLAVAHKDRASFDRIYNWTRQNLMVRAPAGFYAVFARCCQLIGENNLGSRLMETAEKKILTEKSDYYSHTLYLLARSVRLP